MRRYLLGGAGALVAMVVIATAAVWPRAILEEKIRTSVEQNAGELAAGWRLPVAASYRPALTSQSNLSRCGPASVANAFRSFGDEPATTEDAVLAGTGRCWIGLCILGLTLDQLADVARAHTHHKVTVLRDLTEEQFREHLRHANDSDRRYIINFSRAPIFGGGSGHFSPIGGYLEAEDRVFVLDVNARFRPWLIKRSRLFEAMNTYDGQHKRGLLLIE